jgi:oxygen-independent coproporphyrinogen-3 oxidase
MITTLPVLSAEPQLDGPPYQGYSYAYPHKTAYRPFAEPIALRALWAPERHDALFLYFHVPLCEMRCGFCNLFTQANPRSGLADTYLDALQRQVDAVEEALGTVRFARLAVGGGTPTILTVSQLERLFDQVDHLLGPMAGMIPASVETSPDTAETDKLLLLRQRGVTRLSLGVQSFVAAETAAVGRMQRPAAVHAALECIWRAGFPVRNIDLIYGLPGQTVARWLDSLHAALRYQPEELYLYPLYVRPLTGLGRHEHAWDDLRLECYCEARQVLLSAGYKQLSMRLFRASHCPDDDGPVYCVQDDGMLGLGCGARSYTRSVHYSGEYAVGARGVSDILADYVARPVDRFRWAEYGFQLDAGEQRRRYVLITLLQTPGLPLDAYRERFGSDVFADLPQLHELIEHDLAAVQGERLMLTDIGLERSDAIGPWLYSPAVRRRMEGYAWR